MITTIPDYYDGRYSSILAVLTALIEELGNPPALKAYVESLAPLGEHSMITEEFVRLNERNRLEDDDDILNAMDHLWRVMTTREKYLCDSICFELPDEIKQEITGHRTLTLAINNEYSNIKD